MRLAVIDTETTGTDPRRHHLWEVGLILREAGQPAAEYAWQVRPDLATADPAALRVGGYRDRCRVAAAAAAGWLACAGRPPSAPWRSDDLARALGIDPASYDRHSALADARYAGAIYDAATAAGAA